MAEAGGRPAVPAAAAFVATFSALSRRLEEGIGLPYNCADATQRPPVQQRAPIHSNTSWRPELSADPQQHFADPHLQARIEEVRQSRRLVHARRERWKQRIRCAQAAIQALSAEQLHRVNEASAAFEHHATATHATALQRLQALFVECVAEMHKAVERARQTALTQSSTERQELQREVRTDAVSVAIQHADCVLDRCSLYNAASTGAGSCCASKKIRNAVSSAACCRRLDRR
jgi:hypothetical protein